MYIFEWFHLLTKSLLWRTHKHMVCMHVLSAIISFVLTSAGSQLQPSSSSVWWSAGSDWLAYSAVWSVQSGRTGYNPKIRRYKNSMSAEDTILLKCGKNNIHTERRGVTVIDVLYTFIYTRSITMMRSMIVNAPWSTEQASVQRV